MEGGGKEGESAVTAASDHVLVAPSPVVVGDLSVSFAFCP